MERPQDIPPCDSRVVESGIRGAVYGALWSAVDCLHRTSREHAGYADGASFRQCARLVPGRIQQVMAFFSVYNGIQCVVLRASARPVAAAWAGGGAAGLAATASTRNARLTLVSSLTCATAAAGVEVLRGGKK